LFVGNIEITYLTHMNRKFTFRINVAERCETCFLLPRW